MNPASSRTALRGTVLLIAIGLAQLLVHLLTNAQYGFHRDELATLDDAHYLAWGYVAYPPLTPFVARVALGMFGTSLSGVRLFGALAQCAAVVVTGLIARELGGNTRAQVAAAVAVALAPVSILWGALFQYTTFDYLWWVLAAYFTARLLNTEDPHWWVATGAAVGLGMMTRYTMGFLALGITGGVLLTPAHRYLRSRWLWAGVATSLVIFLPNILWQVQHNFISADFLRSMHSRDVRVGRSDGFLPHQFFVPANPFTVPLWLAGLWFYFGSKEGRRFRLLGWMFVIPLALFTVSKGRDYYTAGSYPMLFAGGAVWGAQWLESLTKRRARIVKGVAWSAVALGVAVGATLVPFWSVNSWWWTHVASKNGDFREEVGWPELVGTVAAIRGGLPEEQRAELGILARNYGEAGAIDLYGPAHGLPKAISGVNSYWQRGYGDPPPRTLIVLGVSRPDLERYFEACYVAGHATNRYGVRNEETQGHPDIFVCRGLREPWPEFWKEFRSFG
ncbi:MAG: glycosyltransferase family 39 protein [Acidobacteriota bacterium]